MLDATQSRQEELSATSSRKLETLRSLLPTSVAERVEAGDRDVLDRVSQASLAVLVLHGIGALVHGSEPSRGREELDDIIAHIDDAARRHGVEPVRLVGDTYLLGCGLNQPFLDHAPRTLAFALEARELVRDASQEADLKVSIGIHTGPVSVGLAGSSHLVYDVWGDTVEFASSLARSARPDELLISDSTRSMLPRDVKASRWSGSAPEELVWEIAQAGVEEGVSG
jgi:class 3 adenylate cyclase